MRKGQEKLIKRAEELLPKEFVEKLMDESFTIEQLESLFRWMLLFKDCPEILDDWDAFCQDAFSFKYIYAIMGDWRRTHELCAYMREKFHGCRCIMSWMITGRHLLTGYILRKRMTSTYSTRMI